MSLFILTIKMRRRFDGHAKCTVQVLTEFMPLLFATQKRTSTLYGGYCIQKSDNNQFHPQFAIIIFKMKSSSFSVV